MQYLHLKFVCVWVCEDLYECVYIYVEYPNDVKFNIYV